MKEASLFSTRFCAHLDMLCEFADVAALDRLDEEGDGRPDRHHHGCAYRGACVRGGRAVKRGLPATLFVARDASTDTFSGGTLLLRPTASWIRRSEIMRSRSGRDGRAHSGLAASEKQFMHRTRCRSQPERDAPTSLRSALKCPGITVGSHTWSHANLAGWARSEVLAEIAHSRAWLRAEFAEKAIDWLASRTDWIGYGSLALQDASIRRRAPHQRWVARLSPGVAFCPPAIEHPRGSSVAGYEHGCSVPCRRDALDEESVGDRPLQPGRARGSLPGFRIAMMLEADEPGGAEMMTIQLSDELRRRGHTIVPVGPEHGVGWLGDVFRRGGFSPEVFRIKRPIDPGCVRGLVQLFREHRIDVVHSQEFNMAVYGAASSDFWDFRN